MKSKSVKTFRAVLEKVESTPPWVIARLPFDPKKAWPEWSSRRVRGSINGFEFQTSLLNTKGQGYWFVVYKKLLKGAGAKTGDKVEIKLEPDLEERVYAEPKELTGVLRQDKDLRRWFNAMTPSTRRWFAMFVDQAKGADTRKQRAERIAELVMQVVEGQEIAPPILRLAFQRQPLAEQGWHASTPAQRRNHLLGIFMTQGVEARERRTAWVIDACLRVAQRKGTKERE
ncbi:MAG TPA: YdeI/OmpD-associated family protein [Terracidiphilus sp.]|nr:YdeI/OmpD-associated family protein [Terracidiphilus sp.]